MTYKSMALNNILEKKNQLDLEVGSFGLAVRNGVARPDLSEVVKSLDELREQVVAYQEVFDNPNIPIS